MCLSLRSDFVLFVFGVVPCGVVVVLVGLVVWVVILFWVWWIGLVFVATGVMDVGLLALFSAMFVWTCLLVCLLFMVYWSVRLVDFGLGFRWIA